MDDNDAINLYLQNEFKEFESAHSKNLLKLYEDEQTFKRFNSRKAKLDDALIVENFHRDRLRWNCTSEKNNFWNAF